MVTGPLLLIALFTIYLTELHDFTPLNTLDQNSAYGMWALNTQLTNSLNKYHPLLFYLSVVLLLVVTMNFGTLYLRSAPFASSCVTNQTFPKMWFVVTLNLIALLLGS